MNLKTAAFTITLTVAAAAGADAAVPTYDVNVVATYTTTTTLRGASDAGHLVGDQVIAGVNRAFVATLDDGLQILPLPAGYTSSIAFDANDSGVIVGTAADNGPAWDSGDPVAWTPDGAGGYAAHLLPNLATAPGPFGQMNISGGQAVAVNNNGIIVGWARYQGFIGGPTVEFDLTAPPHNLKEMGFQASVTCINDNNVIAGGGLRMDMNSGVVTNLGVPDPLQPGNVSFTNVIAYAINDAGETVVAADLASTVFENYLTYMHNDADGFIRLNPAALPSRFVGFYDNNDLGDVSASGGVLFRAEGALVPGYDALLNPADANWDTNLGFIDNNRRVATTAYDFNADVNALVLLTPITPVCPGDANGDGFVNFDDLNLVLSNWNLGPSDGDVNGDDQTDFDDLNLILSNWNAAC